MTADRKLLEAAAKAAGVEWFGYFGDDDCECRYLDIGPEDVVEWNPLTSDGDALRLAVKLKINIEHLMTINGASAGVNCWPSGRGDCGVSGKGGEEGARRAIVCAAAAMVER